MLTISIIALVVSVFSLPFTAWAARATARQAKTAREQTQIQRDQVEIAREQTQLQRALALEATQPYVWADIQPDVQQGTVLNLVVGNSGPTVATDVRITFDRPLPAPATRVASIQRIQETLANGLTSLAPGRVIRWSLGSSHDLMAEDASQFRSLRVEANGPHGPLPTLELGVDINEWRQSRDAPDGSLHHVRGAVEDLTKAVGGIDKTLNRVADRLPEPDLGDAELGGG